MTTYCKIGQIINTHGHRGEIKIYPLTDDLNRYFELEHVYIKKGDEYKEYHLDRVRTHQGLVLLFLKEIEDMNEAEKLKGLYIELPLSELKPLPQGQYYNFQLIGQLVYENGHLLGKVTEILKTGSNDVYVIKDAQGREICLPALKEVVRSIDLTSGRMEVKLPAGLLD